MRQNHDAEEQFFEKHRQEVRDYSVDWVNELASAETLSGTPTVYVLQKTGNTFTDTSSQFGITGNTASGTKSQFRLSAATGTDQDEHKDWYVRVDQATSTGQTLVSIHRLYVSEFADTAAP